MRELYSDIPDYIRILTEFWAKLALQQKNPMDGAKMMQKFIDSCSNKRYQDYIDFYFQLQLAQVKNNESIND